jgi:hypothetical protein
LQDVEGKMSIRFRGSAIGLIVASTIVATAKESVSIQVSPSVSFAPADLRIRTSVEPDADNRAITIVADSESFYRASAIQLDGDRSPKTTVLTFHSLPPGEYNVTAVVIGADGKERALAHARVEVIASH